MSMRATRGRTLAELAVALGLAMSLAAVAIPRGWTLVQEYRLRGACLYLRSLFRQVRSLAAARSVSAGIVFDQVDGEPELAVHLDGNGNGIRRADVDSGVDPRIRGPWRLSAQFPGVRYGTPPAGAGEPGLPGLRIGPSHILSFSPLGSSSSGTLFLSNGQQMIYGVIVLGATGRVRVARYRDGRWEPLL